MTVLDYRVAFPIKIKIYVNVPKKPVFRRPLTRTLPFLPLSKGNAHNCLSRFKQTTISYSIYYKNSSIEHIINGFTKRQCIINQMFSGHKKRKEEVHKNN